MADAGVAGVPDREWGEAITAFVVLSGEATGEELRDWARERLAPHKVPKRVERVTELPRNAAGKLQRNRLRERTRKGSDPGANFFSPRGQTRGRTFLTTVATIGVYGFSAETFLGALRGADVNLVLDVRQRRGVRGSEYAWANSRRLQAALADAGIAYRHHPELAPTTELRHLQYAVDERQRVGKRSRTELAPEYRERYVKEILDHADLDAVVTALPQRGAAALLCVERDPEACHRSLIAERLAERHGVRVEHLRPG